MPTPNQKKVYQEILAIMNTYREQEASARGVDTPEGLEHMGDVWTLLLKWGRLLSEPAEPPADREQVRLEAMEKERDALAAAACDLAEAMEFCHHCGGAILINEGPLYCEDCPSGCEHHDPPDCVGIEALHQRLKLALVDPSAILATIRQEARRAALVEAQDIAVAHTIHGEFFHGGRNDCIETIVEELGRKMAEAEQPIKQ